MRLLHKDAIAGTAMVVLAVAYWIGADGIPKSLLEGGVGAGALPKLLGVLLVVLSVILVLQSIVAGRRAKRAEEEAESEVVDDGQPSTTYRRLKALGFLLICIGYIVIVEFVGYAPAIAYLLAAIVWFAGGASRRYLALFAIVGAVFFWVLFVEVLGIRQPKGFWPDLWKQIGYSEQGIGEDASGTALL